LTAPKDKSGHKSLHMLKRCLAYFMRYKARVGLAIVGMIVVAPCAAASAWLVPKTVDDVLINKDIVALTFVTIGIVVLMTGKGIFRFMQNYYRNTAGRLAVIVDQGKHAKLLQRCEIHRTLYEMQFGAD